jgi:hypothetical protein
MENCGDVDATPIHHHMSALRSSGDGDDVDGCLSVFYECKSCGALLKPHVGDCCVFCSYGSVPCPPIQAASEGKENAASCCKTSSC